MTVYGDPDKNVIRDHRRPRRLQRNLAEEHWLLNKACGKSRSQTSSSAPTRRPGHAATVETLDKPRSRLLLGDEGGVSIGIIDMIIPKEKQLELDSAYKQIAVVEKQYRAGIITDGERYNKIIDVWTHAGEEIRTSCSAPRTQ